MVENRTRWLRLDRRRNPRSILNSTLALGIEKLSRGHTRGNFVLPSSSRYIDGNLYKTQSASYIQNKRTCSTVQSNPYSSRVPRRVTRQIEADRHSAWPRPASIVGRGRIFAWPRQCSLLGDRRHPQWRLAVEQRHESNLWHRLVSWHHHLQLRRSSRRLCCSSRHTRALFGPLGRKGHHPP